MFHAARRGETRVEPRASRFFFALILFVLPAIGLSQSITEYAVPTAAPTDLYGITKGPDGAVWFGESRTAKIGRVAPDGTITEFSTTRGKSALSTRRRARRKHLVRGRRQRRTNDPERTGHVFSRRAGWAWAGSAILRTSRPVPEGALWYADGVGRIGKITTAGVVTIFPLPPSQHVGAYPYTIAAGPDGNLWFTDGDDQEIERMTPTGVLTDFPVTGFRPYDITAGPDGAMWFTIQPAAGGGPGGIGRITTAGDVRTFPLNDGRMGDHGGSGRESLVHESEPAPIGRITPDGVVTRVPAFDSVGGPDRHCHRRRRQHLVHRKQGPTRSADSSRAARARPSASPTTTRSASTTTASRSPRRTSNRRSASRCRRPPCV